MKLLLHYLKFDFLRWRWLVIALWALVALHSGVFVTAELMEQPEWALDFSTVRLAGEIALQLANGTLLWATALIFLMGAADSPVRRRTWLLTRAGNRRIWIAARMGFVMLAVVLPLAVGYAMMPLAAGFNALTILHAFWLALKVAAPLAAALWLWVRAWPHLPYLLLASALTFSLGMIGYVVGLSLPVGWFALPPSWLAMVFFLTLPALICLRAAGKPGRQPALHGGLAGLLVPLLWVAGGAFSHGLRVLFPGRLERTVFEERKTLLLRPAAGDLLEPGFPVSLDVPFWQWDSRIPASLPVLVHAEILAASWQRIGESKWSQWLPASGSISSGKEGPALHLIRFDWRGLRGEEHLSLQLKTLLTLAKMEAISLPEDSVTDVNGHGWTYEAEFRTTENRHFLYELGRAAPGMHPDSVVARRGPLYESGWSPVTSGSIRRFWLPGYHFADRKWDANWLDPKFNLHRLPQGPISIEVYEGERCLRILRLESVRVVIGSPKEAPPVVPPAAPATVKPPEIEPFQHYISSTVWPQEQTLPVPAAGASPHEVAYFIHWLKGQKTLPDPKQAASLVPVWWPQFLDIAVLEQLRPGNALLQVLAAGLPEEHRGELLTLLPKAPWLAPGVEQRGWQAEAKPFVLEAVRRAGLIKDELMPLCRSYRDAAFNEWMRRGFKLDVPTVLYWESIPELAADLPKRLKIARYSWRYNREANEALLTAGDVQYLSDLLDDLRRRRNSDYTAHYLERAVLDANGNPPPPTGLVLLADGRVNPNEPRRISPEFLRWFGGLTADDFTFDRIKRRFVRKSSAPKAP